MRPADAMRPVMHRLSELLGRQAALPKLVLSGSYYMFFVWPALPQLGTALCSNRSLDTLEIEHDVVKSDWLVALLQGVLEGSAVCELRIRAHAIDTHHYRRTPAVDRLVFVALQNRVLTRVHVKVASLRGSESWRDVFAAMHDAAARNNDDFRHVALIAWHS